MKKNPSLETLIAELPPEARRQLDQFKTALVAHPRLQQVEQDLLETILEPAGFAYVLLMGPTGVGKSTVIKQVVRHFPGSAGEAPFGLQPQPGRAPVPLLVMEPWAQAPAFNRAHFYRTGLRLLGESTLGELGVAQASARKGRKVDPFQDIPELRLAYQEALIRREVRAVLLDEAEHLLNVGTGADLLDQLDWLKSLTNATGVLHVLCGPYALLAFRDLSGQAARRGLTLHFSRYQIASAQESREFQGALLSLLKEVPLQTDLEALLAHWLTCYERTIGCVGVLRNWLVRALAIALHRESQELTWTHLIARALPVAHCHRLALEAATGERDLADTEEQRQQLWKLLRYGLPAASWDGDATAATFTRPSQARPNAEVEAPATAGAKTARGRRTTSSSSKAPGARQQGQAKADTAPEDSEAATSRKAPVGQRKPHRDPVGESGPG